MDRMEVSGTFDLGSIPSEATKFTLNLLINSELRVFCRSLVSIRLSISVIKYAFHALFNAIFI